MATSNSVSRSWPMGFGSVRLLDGYGRSSAAFEIVVLVKKLPTPLIAE
jgi:hypothetical protein